MDLLLFPVLTEKPELVKLMNEKAVINTMSAPTKTSKERHKRYWDREDIAAEESDDDADGHDHVHQCPNCSDEAAAAAAARAGEDYVSPEVKASRFLEKASALQHVELQLGEPTGPPSVALLYLANLALWIRWQTKSPSETSLHNIHGEKTVECASGFPTAHSALVQ